MSDSDKVALDAFFPEPSYFGGDEIYDVFEEREVPGAPFHDEASRKGELRMELTLRNCVGLPKYASVTSSPCHLLSCSCARVCLEELKHAAVQGFGARDE